MLTRAPQAFCLLAPSGDTNLRIMVLDATLFITQVELKPLFFLLKLMFCELNAKHIILWHILRLKTLLRVLGSSRSLSIMHSLDQFQKGFVLHWLRTLHSLVLQVQIHFTLITLISYLCKRSSAPFQTTHYGLFLTFGATMAYETLFPGTGMHHDGRANTITIEMFTKGLLRFRLWPNTKQRGGRRTYNPPTSGRCAHWGTVQH